MSVRVVQKQIGQARSSPAGDPSISGPRPSGMVQLGRGWSCRPSGWDGSPIRAGASRHRSSGSYCSAAEAGLRKKNFSIEDMTAALSGLDENPPSTSVRTTSCPPSTSGPVIKVQNQVEAAFVRWTRRGGPSRRRHHQVQRRGPRRTVSSAPSTARSRARPKATGAVWAARGEADLAVLRGPVSRTRAGKVPLLPGIGPTADRSAAWYRRRSDQPGACSSPTPRGRSSREVIWSRRSAGGRSSKWPFTSRRRWMKMQVWAQARNRALRAGGVARRSGADSHPSLAHGEDPASKQVA